MDTQVNTSLTILPVKPPEQERIGRRELDERLPIADGSSQLCLMISPIKTGKSTIVNNLLLREEFYRDFFDDVYMISPTIFIDKTHRFLAEDPLIQCYDEYSDELVDAIIEHQLSFDKEVRPLAALILDDILGLITRHSRVAKLGSRFRHYNFGLLLLSTQMFKSVPPVIRGNVTMLIIGSPWHNEEELDKVAETYGEMFEGKENFKALYRSATPERYNFIMCKLDENPAQMWKGFEEQIYPAAGNEALAPGEEAPERDEEEITQKPRLTETDVRNSAAGRPVKSRKKNNNKKKYG